VFTGVSGSGKSSLVFGANETYSAFVQGFMPTLARPEVDVLDRLTTAIIVGRIVFEGTPTDLVTARSTLTGEHLAAYVGT
jgi:excinuclease UvrABC ATPase subunit